MFTQEKCIDYLLSTSRNYTCTRLAAHLPEVSHDQVNRFLRDSSFSSSQSRELVAPLLNDSLEAFLPGLTHTAIFAREWAFGGFVFKTYNRGRRPVEKIAF